MILEQGLENQDENEVFDAGSPAVRNPSKYFWKIMETMEATPRVF
jgi:hypothetical protein